MRKLIALSVTLAALGCSGSPGGNQSSSTTSEGSSSVGSTATSSESSSATTRAGSSASSSTSTSNASSGGTSSSSNACGTDTCDSCPCGYASNDQCLNGSWSCACAVASGSSCSATNNSSSGSSTSSSSCGVDTCSVCPPGCLNADSCTSRGWQCGCACVGNSSSSSSGNSSTSSSSSGGSSTTVACNLDGGTPTLVGTWMGNASFGETFGNMGGGGGGPDTETVVANGTGIEFQTFSTMVLANCALPFTLTNATSASVVAGTTCADTARGQWTFQAGTATLDATGCVMTVTTSGTVVDPKQVPGTFTTSATLDLQ